MTSISLDRSQRWLSVALCSLALVACGDSGPATTEVPSAPSDAAKLAQLEASGAIPKLERLPMIEGIDIDRNGVRDDIDAYVAKTYTDEAQRRAAVQMARAYQAMLLVDKSDERALDEVSMQGSRAVACLSAVFVSDSEIAKGDQMLETLESLTTNTKERLKAYLAYNKARSGSVSQRIGSNTCE